MQAGEEAEWRRSSELFVSWKGSDDSENKWLSRPVTVCI